MNESGCTSRKKPHAQILDYYIYRLALGCIVYVYKQNHNTIILLVTEVKYAAICAHGVGR